MMELEPQGIGVSVLCPGWVATLITGSRRNWPKDYGPPPPKDQSRNSLRSSFGRGMTPSDVAALVLKAVQDNERYIFTHPDMRPLLEKRVDQLLAAYRKLDPASQEVKR